ncbi:MAG: diguanylate cyclase [bacterium]|nr:diguanylate cyclase [bacterium]
MPVGGEPRTEQPRTKSPFKPIRRFWESHLTKKPTLPQAPAHQPTEAELAIPGYELVQRDMQDHNFIATSLDTDPQIARKRAEMVQHEVAIQKAAFAMMDAGLLDRDSYINYQANKAANLDMQKRVEPQTFLMNKLETAVTINEQVAKADPQKDRVVVRMKDVKRFKLVNDKYTMAKGDELMVEIANVLRTRVPATNFLAMYGGDEFVEVETVPIERLARRKMNNKPEAERRATITQEELQEIGKRLGIDVEGLKVSFHEGEIVVDKGESAPSALLRVSQKLNEAKDHYYDEHPDEKRKE